MEASAESSSLSARGMAWTEELLQHLEEERALRRQLEARLARLEAAQETHHSQLEGRVTAVEESVARAVGGVMPKVEQLLARFQAPAVPQPRAHGDASSSAVSAAPGDGGSIAPAAAPPSPGGGDSPHEARDAVGATESIAGAVLPAPSAVAATPVSPKTPPESSSETSDPPASLHEAAARGDTAAVRRFLDGGVKVDARDKDGNTALHVAASNGRTDVVDALLASGSAVNKIGDKSRRPLHRAAAGGHSATVARLVAGGAALNVQDKSGATALALAARGGHTAVVQWLVEQGASVEMADKMGKTILTYAIEGRNENVGTYIVEKGANVNTVDEKGETNLFTAVAMQCSWAVKLLLEKGVSPLAKNKENEFPLFLASKRGYGDLVGDLLKATTEINAEMFQRCLCATSSGDVVWIFADNVHDVVLGKAGEEVLRQAARDGHLEVVESLLQVGVNPSSDSFENSAFKYAAQEGHSSCLQVLLQACDPPGYLHREETLYFATRCGHVDCIVALLDAGADINAQTVDYGYSPLHCAVLHGKVLAVQEFLRRGADKNLQDKWGRTPLNVALEWKEHGCAAILC